MHMFCYLTYKSTILMSFAACFKSVVGLLILFVLNVFVFVPLNAAVLARTPL